MKPSQLHFGARVRKALATTLTLGVLAAGSLAAAAPASAATVYGPRCSTWRQAGTSAVYARFCATVCKSGPTTALYSSVQVRNVGRAARGVYLSAALRDTLLGSRSYGSNTGHYVSIPNNGRVYPYVFAQSVATTRAGTLTAYSLVVVNSPRAGAAGYAPRIAH